jgi:adenosylhomocysteine nucleosidase
MEPEIENLIKQSHAKIVKTIGQINFYVGTIRAKEVVLVKSGIGKVAASVCATLLIDLFKPDLIINTGIAGGIGMHTGDIMIATRLSYSDADATVFGYRKGQIPGMPETFPTDQLAREDLVQVLNTLGLDYVKGNVLTADSFITSLDQIKVPYDLPCACEMEGAAIAQACYMNCVKFLSIRYISDIIGTDEQVDNYNAFEESMAYKSTLITLALIDHIYK